MNILEVQALKKKIAVGSTAKPICEWKRSKKNTKAFISWRHLSARQMWVFKKFAAISSLAAHASTKWTFTRIKLSVGSCPLKSNAQEPGKESGSLFVISKWGIFKGYEQISTLHL